MVATALGDVAPADLGFTLSHEHVAIKDLALSTNYPHIAPRDKEMERAVAKMKGLVERGVKTIIDLTTVDLGRDIGFIVEASRASGLQVIPCTGWHRSAPPYFRRQPVDTLATFLVHDIREGIAGSGVRAGIIKLASGADVQSGGVERLFRAGARAHRATGVPISTHTETHEYSGDLQQKVFLDEGVDLSRVTIGHSGDSTDLAYLKRLMERGSSIGMDRFGLGHPEVHRDITNEQRIATVVELCKQGYAEKMVLSHDAIFTAGFNPGISATEALNPNWQPNYVNDTVIPALREAGVTDDQIDLMMVENHRRIFEHDAPY